MIKNGGQVDACPDYTGRFCEAAWGEARRATIKAHPSTPHPARPYGQKMTPFKNLPSGGLHGLRWGLHDMY